MTRPDGSTTKWPLDQLDDWLSRELPHASDRMTQAVLQRIKASDPDYTNVGNLSNITYERPEVRVKT